MAPKTDTVTEPSTSDQSSTQLPPCFGKSGGRFLARDRRFSGQIYQLTAATAADCYQCGLRSDCFQIRCVHEAEGRR